MNEEVAGLPGVWVADTVTKLPKEAVGAVIVTGSHGGRYPGYQAAAFGVRGVIFNDAGIGRDDAGVGSLPYLEKFAIAAAVVSHESARIGDAGDILERGIVSRCNPTAAAIGVSAGQGARVAAGLLRSAAFLQVSPEKLGEARTVLSRPARPIVLIDSAALVRPEDKGAIVITGSHGALVGGQPAMALQVDGFAAAYNDAGIGIENAGITRLPALDARGIAGITVSAQSARIGEARSTYEDGIISAANETARRLGAEIGMPARIIIDRWSGQA